MNPLAYIRYHSSGSGTFYEFDVCPRLCLASGCQETENLLSFLNLNWQPEGTCRR